MSRKLVVGTFDYLDVAQRCARDLSNLASDGNAFEIESAAMVQRGANGRLAVLKQYTESYWGIVIGAATGGLIGVVAGPPGVLAGVATGAGAVLAGNTIEHALDRNMTTAIEDGREPGCVALILETTKAPEYEVENVALGYGGKLFVQQLL